MKLIIDIPDEVYKRMKDNSDYDFSALIYAIDNGITPCDWKIEKETEMSSEEAIKVLNTILATVNHHLDLPMTVTDINDGLTLAIEALKNDKANAIKRDVWDLYQRHQSHLGTYVYEFGIELKELLNRYGE